MSNSVKEMTNVCDMPRRACTIIHKSDLTGAYYLEIVSYDDRFEITMTPSKRNTVYVLI